MVVRRTKFVTPLYQFSGILITFEKIRPASAIQQQFCLSENYRVQESILTLESPDISSFARNSLLFEVFLSILFSYTNAILIYLPV